MTEKIISEYAPTHEPEVPVSWPEGHVGVELTGPEHLECIEIVVHGVTHYVHSTTARALQNMLEVRLAEWNKSARSLGSPGVDDVVWQD